MAHHGCQIFRFTHVVKTRRTVALARARAHVPGQHVKAGSPQGVCHAQHILAVAVALKPVRNYRNGARLPKGPFCRAVGAGGVLVNIKKIAVGRINAHPAHAGGNGWPLAKKHGPHGIDMTVAHIPRRIIH